MKLKLATDKSRVKKKKKLSAEKKSVKVVIYTILLVGTVIMALPFIWMIVTSFKPLSEIHAYPPTFVVHEPTIKAYIKLFTLIPMGRYFFNSIFVASAITLANLFFCSLAGYAFAKHQFAGRDKIFLLLIGSLMIPWQVNLIPQFIIIKHLGWLNSYKGLIIPAMSTAFGVFLMRQFIKSIPNDLLDAAKIDGCSEFRIYWTIILPLVKPALAALAIFTFMMQWNNFVWPLVIIHSKEMKTIPLALSVLNSQFGDNFAMVMGGAVIATIPVIVVFILFQKFFIKGITFTGLKV